MTDLLAKLTDRVLLEAALTTVLHDPGFQPESARMTAIPLPIDPEALEAARTDVRRARALVLDLMGRLNLAMEQVELVIGARFRATCFSEAAARGLLRTDGLSVDPPKLQPVHAPGTGSRMVGWRTTPDPVAVRYGEALTAVSQAGLAANGPMRDNLEEVASVVENLVQAEWRNRMAEIGFLRTDGLDACGGLH